MSNEYEAEYTPIELQEDEIYVRDGRGRLVKLEVEDDVAED